MDNVTIYKDDEFTVYDDRVVYDVDDDVEIYIEFMSLDDCYVFRYGDDERQGVISFQLIDDHVEVTHTSLKGTQSSISISTPQTIDDLLPRYIRDEYDEDAASRFSLLEFSLMFVEFVSDDEILPEANILFSKVVKGMLTGDTKWLHDEKSFIILGGVVFSRKYLIYLEYIENDNIGDYTVLY